MSANCGDSHCSTSQADSPAYRRVLWLCLWANAIMFVVQIIASHLSHSVAVLANSLDFFSDAANYAISIYVLGHSLVTKAKASIFKGLTIALIGLWTAVETIRQISEPVLPAPMMMTVVSIIGMAVNMGCLGLLWRYRMGDSNARSVWLCSRNDVLGNIAVIAAAGGVFAFTSIWPDAIVAAILAWLAISAAWQIIALARKELKDAVSSN